MKKIIAFILFVLLMLTACGCDEGSSSAIIYYGVISEPETLDPQTAESFIELMISRNIYEGLLRESDTGEIVNGIAESYTVNGLTYTFKLRRDAVWSNGDSVTAHDFVFGFQRAVDPKTTAPNAELLFSIKNAEKISNGEMNVSALGVTATDDYTLQIELQEKDNNLLYTLTTAVAMPCNQKFFNNTVGKYGMSAETTLSNGSYELTKWVTEDFAMRIRKNKEYTGLFIPKNAAVYFSYNDERTTLESLQKSAVDIAEITNEQIDAAGDEFTVATMENKVLLLSLGNGYSQNMKHALHLSYMQSGDFAGINSSFTFADRLYPNVFDITDTPKIDIHNPTLAKQLYNAEILNLENKEFPQTTLYYSGDDSITDIVKTIASHWQQDLGAYINISKLDSDSSVYYKTVDDQYHLAAYSFEINEKNHDTYMQHLNLGDKNPVTEEEYKDIYRYSNIIPLAYYGTAFAYDECLTNVPFFDTNGFIDFSVINKDI